MTLDTLRAFVNELPVTVPAGADVSAALRARDPALEAAVLSGGAYVTDGRGIRIDPSVTLSAGAILRVIVPSRKGTAPAADSHADP